MKAEKNGEIKATMAPPARKAIAGSIHRIREFELEKVNLAEEFDILQIVGEGWFGKILLVEHRGTDTEMVLKALPKPYVPLRDFYREFHYGLHLGTHKNVITTYDVAFETAGFYVFSQEYAPLGDLTSNVSDTGIGELHTKRVAKQLAAALDHLHARDLVHRDVKLDNILIFKSDFSRIKLCDFGETRKSQTVIRRRNEWLPYAPPEVLKTPVEDTYKAVTSHDVWQFGIVIFVCLTGCLPWQKAALDDPRYVRYLNWYNTANPLRKQPKLFKLVSSRAQKFFKKILEPRPDKRPPTLGDFQKYLDDRWMAKGINEKNGTEGTEIDELCPSMYSFHSDINEKNKLLHIFYEAGIETTVDRVAKKERIRQWIQNSVINEEDENENNSSNLNSMYNSDAEEETIENVLHPIEQNHQRWSSMRYSDEKHINPRTGEILGTEKSANNPNISFDMQHIQPLTANNAFLKQKMTKDNESPSQSSMKDSAYGSIDFKMSSPTTTDNPMSLNEVHDQKAFPSQQLQQVLQKTIIKSTNPMIGTSYQNFHKSPLPNSKQNLNKNNMMNSQFASRELTPQSKAKSVNNLTTSLPLSNLNRNTKNTPLTKSAQLKNSQVFSSMKDTPYDSNGTLQTNKYPLDITNGPDNTLNVVQGQMKINPYATSASVNRNMNGKAMNPKMMQLEAVRDDDEIITNHIELTEAELDSLMQIKKMLIETKTGLPE
ncbi:uncharacterized protein LOC143919160 isoform X2 [Arctopsyche grandis]|uniref:uncharacterized protein LOC143919160 isoform X2 n=1 Tax=Arctopsyche grandis TaxID=121162 RepID=UPI00406D8E6B